MQTITVVIPTNRLGPWMDAAAQSVLESVGVDIDLVVVLDGISVPEGNPPAWARDHRVRLIRNPISLGPSVAMTKAMEIARGEFIARLDSDDLVAPTRLTLQVEYLKSHPQAVAVGSRTERIDEAGASTGLVRLPFGDDIRNHLLLSNVVPHSSLMFRRSVGIRVGGYDPTLRQMEDYDFILRLATAGPIAMLEQPLVRYRVHSTQTSQGAQPVGSHIRTVIAGRYALARALGRSAAVSSAKNLLWRAVQHLRYRGIVRPGHER